MVRDKSMTTRVSQEAYKTLLQKCADQGCSTYDYLRWLVHADVGLDAAGDAPAEVQEPVEEDSLLKRMLKNE